MSNENVRQFPRRKLQPFEVIYPVNWQGQEAAPVRWLVKNCIPRGTVCMFSGDSGLGKSLLTQQLQTAAATNKPWLGFEVEPCRSFGFYCEDPSNVLHLRQNDICRHLDVSLDDLEDMSLTSRIGMDNVLMDFNRRTDEGNVTAAYEQIRNHVRDFGAQLVIVDTLAHTFNGNENIRSHVTAFVSALQKIASEIDGAVVLNSHPSVSSMQSGTGYSGSTAWKATVRAHMYLKRPKGYDDESDDCDHDERVLKTMKSNWGPGGGLAKLRYQDGVFVRQVDERVAVNGQIDRLTLDRALMDAVRFLMKRGERIAAGNTSRNSLANLVHNLPSCRQYQRRDVLNATDRLIEEGKFVVVRVGPQSRSYALLRTSDTSYPGEQEGNP